MTLVFIGETSSDLVPEITMIMQNALASIFAFSVDLDHTGCFRHGGKELWWIGSTGESTSGNDALRGIRQRIGEGLDMAGIHYDRRPFRAHITLGREIKPIISIEPGENQLIVPIKRISLMKSEHLKGLLRYTEVFGQDLILRA